ncbi:MAG: glycosyltransferase family 4 protein [Kiritimatiellae bacterium]|nr:glycosyltransferase family 4 protein [Kiritimatiellia bacterium]MDW8458676.1 glycosyltransferase family 4 protein [Verrucomicrobiota bacterium]
MSYLHAGFPASPLEVPPSGGGGIKYLWMEKRFPHSFPESDIVYAVSSAVHPRGLEIMHAARKAGIPVVWNQNGAYFPHSYGQRESVRGNLRMADCLRRANYVFYQSEFAKKSSDHFLGTCDCPWEILYNAVDVSRYSISTLEPGKPLIILAAGSHDDAYRIPLVLQTFDRVRAALSGVKLIVAGRLRPEDRLLLEKRAAAYPAGELIVIGPYRTEDAPALFQRAHIFLHAKATDVCPSVVIEAMAAGLPVVYSATGGTPELVGDAGIGIPGNTNWDLHEPPEPEALADAICEVSRNWHEFSRRARKRAEERFDLKPWLDRHEAVFRMLIAFQP